MEQVKVCSCGYPLVWTFIFSGAEWYCCKCGNSLPMMNAYREDATPALTAERDRANAWFHEVTDAYIPHRCYWKDCKECETRETYHYDHASKEALEASRAAYEKLKAGIPDDYVAPEPAAKAEG